MKINPANRKGDIKKGKHFLCERNAVKFDFIKDNSRQYAVRSLCRVMLVSSSAYYAWAKHPGQLISVETLHFTAVLSSYLKTVEIA